MKDLGVVHYCLGVKVDYDVDAGILKLSQSQYVQNMLQKYGMTDCKSISTPLDANVKLTKSEEETPRFSEQQVYQSAVGSLLYAAVATRPDISYAVGAVAKFCSDPSQEHICGKLCGKGKSMSLVLHAKMK